VSAARVVRMLLEKGYRNVRPLQGGLDAWIAAGHEVAVYETPNEERTEHGGTG